MALNAQASLSRRAVNWNSSLSSRQRVLLHAQPIMQMRQSWTSRDDEELRYDPMCLTMKLFDVVIDQSGFGSEVVRETVADALCPLLESLDEAARIPCDKARYKKVVDRLLAGSAERGKPQRVLCRRLFGLRRERTGEPQDVRLQAGEGSPRVLRGDRAPALVGGDQPLPQCAGPRYRERADRQRGGRAVPA